MSALTDGCLGLGVLLLLGALWVLAAIPLVARRDGVTLGMQWRRVRDDVASFAVSGALFLLTGLVIGWLG